jgi:hypothetical protein
MSMSMSTTLRPASARSAKSEPSLHFLQTSNEVAHSAGASNDCGGILHQ